MTSHTLRSLSLFLLTITPLACAPAQPSPQPAQQPKPPGDGGVGGGGTGGGGTGSGGGGTGGGTDGGTSSSTDDMGGTTTAGTLGCNGLIACLNAAMSDADAMACDAKATMQAGALLDAAYQCGGDFCLGNKGVAARCKLDATMMTFQNLDGTAAFDMNGPTGDCGACLLNSTAHLDGSTCEPATDPACNPSVCAASANACLADTP